MMLLRRSWDTTGRLTTVNLLYSASLFMPITMGTSTMSGWSETHLANVTRMLYETHGTRFAHDGLTTLCSNGETTRPLI